MRVSVLAVDVTMGELFFGGRARAATMGTSRSDVQRIGSLRTDEQRRDSQLWRRLSLRRRHRAGLAPRLKRARKS
jgi:hypothetical protein